MEVVISKVVTNLDEEVYLLLQLFDLEGWGDEFVFRGILTLEMQDGAFKGLQIKIVHHCFVETVLALL
jgi:hypothetical protein